MTKLGSMSTGIPASALSRTESASSATASTQLSKLTLALGEEADLPILGRVWIQLVSHHAANLIEGETLKSMRESGIPFDPQFAFTVDLERKTRTLAMAVYEIAEDGSRKIFGTTDEWRTKVNDDLIYACHLKYDEIKARLDPLSFDMTSERSAEIMAAIQKKNQIWLLSFGTAELVSFLLSTDVQRLIFPTPSSGNTESSSEIS